MISPHKRRGRPPTKRFKREQEVGETQIPFQITPASASHQSAMSLKQGLNCSPVLRLSPNRKEHGGRRKIDSGFDDDFESDYVMSSYENNGIGSSPLRTSPLVDKSNNLGFNMGELFTTFSQRPPNSATLASDANGMMIPNVHSTQLQSSPTTGSDSVDEDVFFQYLNSSPRYMPQTPCPPSSSERFMCTSDSVTLSMSSIMKNRCNSAEDEKEEEKEGKNKSRDRDRDSDEAEAEGKNKSARCKEEENFFIEKYNKYSRNRRNSRQGSPRLRDPTTPTATTTPSSFSHWKENSIDNSNTTTSTPSYRLDDLVKLQETQRLQNFIFFNTRITTKIDENGKAKVISRPVKQLDQYMKSKKIRDYRYLIKQDPYLGFPNGGLMHHDSATAKATTTANSNNSSSKSNNDILFSPLALSSAHRYSTVPVTPMNKFTNYEYDQELPGVGWTPVAASPLCEVVNVEMRRLGRQESLEDHCLPENIECEEPLMALRKAIGG